MRHPNNELKSRRNSYIKAIKDYLNGTLDKDTMTKRLWAAGLSYGQTEEGYRGIKNDIAKIASNYPELRALLLSIIASIDEEKHQALECSAFSERAEKAAIAGEQANRARELVAELQNAILEIEKDLDDLYDTSDKSEKKHQLEEKRKQLRIAEVKAETLWKEWRVLEKTAARPTVGDRYIVAKKDAIPIGTKGIVKRVWQGEHGLRVLLSTEHGTDVWVSVDKLERF